MTHFLTMKVIPMSQLLIVSWKDLLIVVFVNANAENYDIPDEVTIMYFFNPFADKILR